MRDGIKAKSQRGKFAEHWWGDRWLKALNRLMDSRRLSRGRSYARRGNVLDIAIEPGMIGYDECRDEIGEMVTAVVNGADPSSSLKSAQDECEQYREELEERLGESQPFSWWPFSK